MSLDLRSLALLRVAYGVLLALDTLTRWTDLQAHYSDLGILTRSQLLELGWHRYWFSLHMAVGHVRWLHLLFALQLLCAVALLVGWRTRLVTFLSWLFLISIHARNPMILNGGDIYLRVLLFWMMFLPWGHRWSWDAKCGNGDHGGWMPTVTATNLKGVAPIAVTIQVASVYWFAALPKNDPSWTVTYDATMLALRVDQFLTPLGYLFRDNFGPLLATLTFIVIWFEKLGPFLLFFPFDRGQTRTLGVLGIMLMHIGFASMMELGFFAWIGALSAIVLLPGWWWEGPLVKISHWADTRFGVAGSRQSSLRIVWLREGFFALVLVYCFCWNCANEKVTPNFLRVPRGLTWIGHATRLDQRWNMFSPGPFTEDGWFVVEGRFKDGRVLDLFKEGGGELRWEKPKDVAGTYKNQRWRKFMMNIWLAENQKYRLTYGQYLCRLWNSGAESGKELNDFDIVYMLENTNLDGTEETPEKKVIWNHWCFEKPD